MPTANTERWLCLACGLYFPPNPGLKACPTCGNTNPPASTTDEVSVRITWHELRILVIWAERWASTHSEKDPTIQKVVYGIADRLYQQHLGRSPLTFMGETTELREKFGRVDQNVIKEPDL